MAIDPNIKKKADDIRMKIKGKEVRESLASGLEEMSSDVVQNEGRQSNVEQRQSTVEDRQTDVENRFDDQMAGNTDVDEVIDARRPEGEEAYPTLRRRLDEEHQEVTTQLAQITTLINPAMSSQEINNLLANGGNFKFTKGVYHLDLTEQIGSQHLHHVALNIQSNTNIVLDPETVLKLNPTNDERYSILHLEGVENVVIEGGLIQGDRNERIVNTGEWGFGVHIRGSENISLRDMTIVDCWGDGIIIDWIDSNTKWYSKNIIIENVTCDNNRRQGISVISVKDLIIKDSLMKNTNGTEPQAGVDLEPDHPNQYLENITIDNLTTKNNNGPGILIAPFQMTRNVDGNGTYVSVNINKHHSDKDLRGIYFSGGEGDISKGVLEGIITVTDSKYLNPELMGVYVENWQKDLFPNVDIINTHVHNPNSNNQSDLGNTGRSAFVVYARTRHPDGVYGGFNFINCTASDGRTDSTVNTLKAFWLDPEKTTQSVDVNIVNPKATTWIDGSFIRWSRGKGNVMFDTPPIIPMTGTVTTDYAGFIVTVELDKNLTLPSAKDVLDREYTFLYTGNSLNLLPKSEDSIIGFDYSPNKTVEFRKEGDLLTLKAVKGNKWLVTKKEGSPFLQGTAAPKSVFYTQSKPTFIGSQGDIALNYMPYPGQYVGWVCVNTTEDGWLPFGKIEI